MEYHYAICLTNVPDGRCTCHRRQRKTFVPFKMKLPNAIDIGFSNYWLTGVAAITRGVMGPALNCVQTNTHLLITSIIYKFNSIDRLKIYN